MNVLQIITFYVYLVSINVDIVLLSHVNCRWHRKAKVACLRLKQMVIQCSIDKETLKLLFFNKFLKLRKQEERLKNHISFSTFISGFRIFNIYLFHDFRSISIYLHNVFIFSFRKMNAGFFSDKSIPSVTVTTHTSVMYVHFTFVIWFWDW